MTLQKRFVTITFMWLIVMSMLFHKVAAQLPAFPGAEGFGKFTTGGRGGEVVHVTNLNDSGAGSFRDAVSKPNRIVVFDVGGVIRISTRIVINRNIYVAGQTAPGGGITIYGNGIAFNGSSGNNIIRYIRIRMGKNGDSGKDAVAISEGQNYLFDHVSVSWGRDGTFDVNGSGIDNITLQDCIVGQGINNSNHSTGGLMQSGKWSIIRSLYIDNKTRNPKARGTHECINSVFYNWGTNGYIMGDTEGLSECNLVGNYFIFGPSSSSNSHITNTTPSFNVYPLDNWVDSNKDGMLNGTRLTDYKTATVRSSRYNYPGVNNLLSAQNALQHVIQYVGASLVRDAVDNLLIQQLTSYGKLGSIINTEDDNGISGNVGTVANGTPPRDTDGDGMSDAWEVARGLNPNVKDDKGDDDGDGYTNIEEYLSCLVGESNDCDAPVVGLAELIKQGAGSSSQTIDLGQAIQGFNFVWTNATTVTVTGLPIGISANINNTAKTITFSGTPTVIGTFTYTITTTGGNPNATRSGTFTVNDPNPKDCNGDINGTAVLDICGVCTGGLTGRTACTGKTEAELVCVVDGVNLESTNAGYTGNGYVNTTNVIGASALWELESASAGQVTLGFRYASGGTSNRDATLIINGVSMDTIGFPPTGAFTTWLTTSTNVTLKAGSNVVELLALSEGGLPNIDYISHSGAVTMGDCIITGVDSKASISYIYLYPNPASTAVLLEGVSNKEWILYNMVGVEVLRGSELQLDISSLPSGVYHLYVEGQVIKLLKE